MPATRIGEYLRARRELVRPEEVGIPDSSRRRDRALADALARGQHPARGLLDPAVRESFPESGGGGGRMVAALRALVGPDVDAPASPSWSASCR